MRRRRAVLVAVLVLLAVAAALYLSRDRVVQYAMPEAVVARLQAAAARAGIALELNDVTAPEPGRLRIGGVRARPQHAGGAWRRVEARDVVVAYQLAPLAGAQPRLTGARIGTLEVEFGRLAFAGAGEYDALGTEAADAIERGAAALARILADGNVLIHRVDVITPAPDGQTRRYEGDRWHITVSPDAGRIDLVAGAWPVGEPATRVDIEGVWRRGRPMHLKLRGAEPDVMRQWGRLESLWPALGELPVQPSAGASRWTCSVSFEPGGAWRVDATADFHEATLTLGAHAVPDWAGTCKVALRQDGPAEPVVVETLELTSNVGDLTAHGTLMQATDGWRGEIAVLLLGIGDVFLDEALEFVNRTTGSLVDAVTVDPGADASVEMRVEGLLAAPTISGAVQMAGGALRVAVTPALPHLSAAEVASLHAAFAYAPERGSMQWRLDAVDGRLAFSALDWTGEGVHGTVAFDSDRLLLGSAVSAGADRALPGGPAQPLRATLRGAEVAVQGSVALAPEPRVDLGVEASITDVHAFISPLGLPAALQVDLPPSADGAVRPAHLTASVQGTGATLVTTAALDATHAHVRLGRVLDKPAGDKAIISGTFRPGGGRVRGDLSVVLHDPMRRGDLRVSGVMVAVPRPDGRAIADADRPFGRWDLVLGATHEAVPMDVMRRYSPVARVIRGYGAAAIDCLFDTTGDEPVAVTWLDMRDVRIRVPRNQQVFALTNTLWRATAYPRRRHTDMQVTADTLDVLDPLLPEEQLGAGPAPPPPDAPTELVVHFSVDSARWRQYTATDFEGRLTHAHGDIALERVHMAMFGGTITGSASLDRDDEAALSARWAGCDVNEALLQMFGVEGAAYGVASGSCRYAGARGAWPDWQGEGTLRIDLPMVVTDLFTDADAEPLWSSVSADTASARFTFDNGRFEVPDVRVERPGVAIHGWGNINLEGDMRFKCFAEVDNALVEQLPLLVRAQYTKPVSAESREIEFTLRDNIRRLRPKVHRSDMPAIIGDLGRGSVTRSGRLLLDLLSWPMRLPQ